MLANSKGQDLVQHLKATGLIAQAMAEYIGVSKDIREKVSVSGLLHDIGKAISPFQGYLKTITSDILIVDESFPNESPNEFPLHHEVGWAYLTKKLKDATRHPILDAIYWHHARPIHPTNKGKYLTYDSADQILTGNISDLDMAAMDDLLKLLEIPSKFLCKKSPSGDRKTPDLFVSDGSLNSNDNAESMLIRACVISADRYISSLCPEDVSKIAEGDGTLFTNIVQGMLSGDIQGNITCPQGYNKGRFDLQVDIVGSSLKGRTTIVKAPAGLGKTMIGLLWSKKMKSKILWVCPRNAVADAVYDNLVKEVEVLGLSCKVELYRTGQRQRTNIEDGRPEFDSDIIVTNIDAIMSPMVNNSIAERLFTVFGAHVVLDEFHEFVSDAPLFAAFVTYMRARHRLSKHIKTLLLSATPSLVQVLWDTDQKTLLLPDANSHYPPQHMGNYQIHFDNNFPAMAVPGSLLVCNSVSEAQANYNTGGYTHLIHHRYTEDDRASKEAAIKASFSKGGNGVKSGESLSAALVVQAAMDISFLSGYDSMCSPESTLQRIGRIDRWGTYQSMMPSLTFLDISGERTERGAIMTVYDLALQEKWCTFLKQNLTGIVQVNLVKMYEIYDTFLQVYHKEVIEYLMAQYKMGMNGASGREFLALVEFYPKKFLDSVVSTTKKPNKSSCKNLRNPDGSYFYTVELLGSPNVWVPANQVLSEGYELYSRYQDLIQNGKISMDVSSMRTRLKGLVACGYTGWTRHSNGKVNLPDFKEWFRMARDPETPFPDFLRVYDSVLGIIKK